MPGRWVTTYNPSFIHTLSGYHVHIICLQTEASLAKTYTHSHSLTQPPTHLPTHTHTHTQTHTHIHTLTYSLTHSHTHTSCPQSSVVSVFQSRNIFGLSFCNTDTRDSAVVRPRWCIAFFRACLMDTPAFA